MRWILVAWLIGVVAVVATLMYYAAMLWLP